MSPAYSQRVLQHFLHAALVIVSEIAGRAADAHVLLNNERTASIHIAHHIHVHAAHTPHLQASHCDIQLLQQRR